MTLLSYPVQRTYNLLFETGLITGVAGFSATAGHLIAMRWIHASFDCHVHRVKLKWATTTAFTAAQQVGLNLVVARPFTVLQTDGTTVTFAGNVGKRKTSQTALSASFLSATAATTVALTAGTHTFDGNLQMRMEGSELAAAGTPYLASLVDEKDYTLGGRPPLILSASEGLVLRNLITLGAGGVARVSMEVEFTIQGV